MNLKSLQRAMVVRGQPAGQRPSVLANTNMAQASGSPGPRPDHTQGQMSARPNPEFAPTRRGPPPFDTDLPTGAGEISLGTSQPRGDAGRDELPLKHKNVYPRRGR